MRGRLQNLVEQSLFARGELEIIVIDSNSPQDERSIVEDFQQKYPAIIYVRTDQRETVYAAWNRGLALASGTFIINANSDDRFTHDGLEKLSDVLVADESLDVAYGDWMVTKVENDGFDTSTDKFVYGYPEFCPPLLLYFQITTHAAIIRASCFEHVGLFKPEYVVFGDRDWMLRFALSGRKARHVPGVVGLYLDSPTSVEHANPDSASEGIALRRHYMDPSQLWRLLSWQEAPVDARQRARCYSLLGVYGKDCARLNGVWTSQLLFSSRCYALALEHDPLDPVSLNNLGVISAVAQDWISAENYLSRALPFDDRGEVCHNLELAFARNVDLSSYHWRTEQDLYLRDKFHVVVGSTVIDCLIDCTMKFLDAFEGKESVTLTLMAGDRLDDLVLQLPERLVAGGYDLEAMPDVRVIHGPMVPSECPAYLEVADLVMGDAYLIDQARVLGCLVLEQGSRETLRQAYLQARTHG